MARTTSSRSASSSRRSCSKDLGLAPEQQTQADTRGRSADADRPMTEPGPRCPILGLLRAESSAGTRGHVAGAPGGPPLPDELARAPAEHDTTLGADIGRWRLGPRERLAASRPHRGARRRSRARGALEGWEATPHQRFERLLRETGVVRRPAAHRQRAAPRLCAARRDQGWLSFPAPRRSATVGRPADARRPEAAARLVPAAQRCRRPAPACAAKKSRDAQAEVSTKLAAQVLGALHELLRGLHAADPARIATLAASRPDHLYEGLLTVLLRLVFLLYAEDRDLMPSRTDARARSALRQGYRVRGALRRLLEDAALNPDTMDERRGGWARLLALFRLVHRRPRAPARSRPRRQAVRSRRLPVPPRPGRAGRSAAPARCRTAASCASSRADDLEAVGGARAAVLPHARRRADRLASTRP